MNSPKKVNLPTSIEHYSNLGATPTHSTTGNFMEYAVARASEMVKGQTYNIDMRTTVRMKPMSHPTYGRIHLHNRAFFVPFRLVMPGFNDFDQDAPWFSLSGSPVRIPNVHRIANSQFVSMFLNPEMSGTIPTAEQATALSEKTYDFVRYSNGNPIPYRFTSLGRYTNKILRSLGYAVYFNGSTSATGETCFHSALPLLCWLRIYFDWYFPSMYVDDSRANYLRRWFNVSPLASNSFQNSLSSTDLVTIFTEVRRVSYDTDFLQLFGIILFLLIVAHTHLYLMLTRLLLILILLFLLVVMVHLMLIIL